MKRLLVVGLVFSLLGVSIAAQNQNLLPIEIPFTETHYNALSGYHGKKPVLMVTGDYASLKRVANLLSDMVLVGNKTSNVHQHLLNTVKPNWKEDLVLFVFTGERKMYLTEVVNVTKVTQECWGGPIVVEANLTTSSDASELCSSMMVIKVKKADISGLTARYLLRFDLITRSDDEAFDVSADYAPDELLVQFVRGTDGQTIYDIFKRMGVERANRFNVPIEPPGIWHVRIKDGSMVTDKVLEFRRLPEVALAEPNVEPERDLRQ